MSCNFCNQTVYMKTVQNIKPALAPMTRVEELRQELLNLTGEVYIPLPNEYCPMCGEKVR